MKKIIIVILLAVSLYTFSQDLRMGIVINPQISWLSPAGSDFVSKESTKFGFDIGLSVEKYFASNYALLTGISLNNVGGGISYSDSVQMKINNTDERIPGNESIDFNLQYIKIPLALKFKTKEIGYFTYFAQIGMEAGVNVKANVSVDANKIDKEKVSDEVRLFNAGYLIGGGAEYSIGGSTSIIVGIQYQNGFLDIISTTNDKVVSPKVTLLLGILF